jgi:pentatricopeptide repeat protein
VREILQRMGEEGVHPREDTFNTLMEGALAAENPDMVPNLFRQLLSLKLRPDSLSYTSLITALSRLSRSEAAVSHLPVLCA